ncbi:Brain and acute leukemia cytoplasmic protein [Oryzias melastigma]|uniref:Brain and acute leukemia cytoplasmic protein n=1 Tax=Oryzias melastigma TaxID=30732 RepID=A0A834CWK8_ORYME|nr:Brain and acute leukemia cytoplasmic protein [Oryzias melastigma]
MGRGASRTDALEPHCLESWTKEAESTWMTSTDTNIPLSSIQSIPSDNSEVGFISEKTISPDSSCVDQRAEKRHVEDLCALPSKHFRGRVVLRTSGRRPDPRSMGEAPLAEDGVVTRSAEYVGSFPVEDRSLDEQMEKLNLQLRSLKGVPVHLPARRGPVFPLSPVTRAALTPSSTAMFSEQGTSEQ